MNSEDQINLTFKNLGDPEKHQGEAGKLSIVLSTQLDLFENVGRKKWTYGGVFMHEGLWHKSPLGKRQYDAGIRLNNMRAAFGLREGHTSILHTGGNFIDPKLWDSSQKSDNGNNSSDNSDRSGSDDGMEIKESDK